MILCHSTCHTNILFICSTSVSGSLSLNLCCWSYLYKNNIFKELTTVTISWKSSSGCNQKSIEQVLDGRGQFLRELMLNQTGPNTWLAGFWPVSLGESTCLSPFGLLWEMPKAGWLINNRNVFLIVLEAKKSKVKVPADLMSGEFFLPDSHVAIFSLCPHIAGGSKGAHWGSLS